MGRKVFSTVWHKHFARLSKFACTAANRGDYNLFRKHVEDIYQMIDTIAKEAGFEQHFSSGQNADAAPVAAESEQPESDKGPAQKNPAGSGKGRKAGK
jgi:hypothetical protein